MDMFTPCEGSHYGMGSRRRQREAAAKKSIGPDPHPCYKIQVLRLKVEG
jgi:hypothetical protein